MPPTGLKTVPACKWTNEELRTLDITAVQIRFQDFFGCTDIKDLPMPQFIYPYFQDILTAESHCYPKDPLVADFFETMVAVTRDATEPTVDILAGTIMTYTGYPLLPGVRESMAAVSMQHQTYFTMSGGKARAHIDLALVDKSQSLLSFC